MRRLITNAILLCVTGCSSACPDALAERERSRNRRSPPVNPGVYIAPDFLTQSIDLESNGDIALGTAPMGGGGITQATFVIWFKHSTSNWPTGSRALVAKNASGQRAFVIASASEGGSGQIQVGFGNGTTMTNGWVPDDVFTGRVFGYLCVSYNAGTVYAQGDGYTITLGGSPSYPATIGASNSQLTIGATVPGTNRWGGFLANVAIWSGWAASEAECRTMWNDHKPLDYRTVGGGIPAPTYYIPGNGASTEVMGNATAVESGTVNHSTTDLPMARRTETLAFTRRFLLNTGVEQADGSYPVGNEGNVYSMNNSLLLLNSGELVMSYSRGTGHTTGPHKIVLARSTDDGVNWPMSGRDYPTDATATEEDIPHGNLTDAASNKRGTALAQIDGIGGGGSDRTFLVFNETQIPGGERTFWIMYNDTAGLTNGSWSAAAELGDVTGPGEGEEWNNVGKGRVFVRQSDSSLLLPYYWKDTGVAKYCAALLRSTDAGVTWTHLVNTMCDASASGPQYEEPQCAYLLGSTTMYCQARVDAGGGVTRDIYHTTSTDHGATWSTPTKSFDGWGAAVFIQTDAGGLIYAANRFDTADANDAYGVFSVSGDLGATWSTPVKFTDRYDNQVLYGDFVILSDGSLALAYPQETTTGAAYLEFGVLRNSWKNNPKAVP